VSFEGRRKRGAGFPEGKIQRGEKKGQGRDLKEEER